MKVKEFIYINDEPMTCPDCDTKLSKGMKGIYTGEKDTYPDSGLQPVIEFENGWRIDEKFCMLNDGLFEKVLN